MSSKKNLHEGNIPVFWYKLWFERGIPVHFYPYNDLLAS